MHRTVLLNLPTTIHSFVRRDPECDTIVINAKLPQDKQRECYLHECSHLDDNDFECEDLNLIEKLAHRKSRCLKMNSGQKGGVV